MEITDFRSINGDYKKELVVGDHPEPPLWCKAYLATCVGQRNSTPLSSYPQSVIRRHPEGFLILQVPGLGRVIFDRQTKTILGKRSHLFRRRDVEFSWQRYEATAALMDGMALGSLGDWRALVDLVTEQLGTGRTWVSSTEEAAQTAQRLLLPGLSVRTLRDLVAAVTCRPLQDSQALRRTA